MEIMNSALLDLLEKINLFYLNFILIYLKVFGTDFFFFFFPQVKQVSFFFAGKDQLLLKGKKTPTGTQQA